MRRLFSRLGAALLATSALAPAVAGAADFPSLVTVRRGETLSHALALSALAPRIAALRAAHPGAIRQAGSLPAITGGTVVPSTIEVGNPFSLPSLQFRYKAGTAGLAFAQFTFTSPNGAQSQTLNFTQGLYSENGSIAFQSTIAPSLNAEPGIWTLTSADIGDSAGNITSYDAAQLGKIFAVNYFNVVNNAAAIDFTPPVVTGGAVLTPTVSMSATFPAFRTMIRGSDAGSGLYLAYVFISPPGQTFAFAQIAPLPLPIRKGGVPANNYIAMGNPTGVWTIAGYALCDLASNCIATENPAEVQALFGTTTFTVTP